MCPNADSAAFGHNRCDTRAATEAWWANPDLAGIEVAGGGQGLRSEKWERRRNGTGCPRRPVAVQASVCGWNQGNTCDVHGYPGWVYASGDV